MSDQARMGSTVLSRRAAVRGAVWAMPAVTVATAAPAFANTSGGMALTGFTAAYAAPDRLVVSGTVVAGTVADAGTLTFTTEPNLFGSIDVVAGATGVVVPNSNGSFSITYTVTPGSFTTTLDLGGDDLAGLFKGYRGEQTFLTADLEPSVAGPEAIPVAQLPRAEIEPVDGYAMWLSPTEVQVAVTGLLLTADAQPSIGRLRIAMKVPAAVYANPNPPEVFNLAPGWMADPLHTVDHWGGGWRLRFVTTQEAHTSLTGDETHRGVGDFSVDLFQDGTGFFQTDRVFIDITSDETAFGWGEDDYKINLRQPYVMLGEPSGPPE